MTRFIILVYFFFTGINTKGQTVDSIPPVIDTITSPVTAPVKVPVKTPKVSQPIAAPDSFSMRPRREMSWVIENGTPLGVQYLSRQVLAHHPWMGFSSVPLYMRSDLKKFNGKETMFYALIALLLMYAVLRNAFPKYFTDLFRLFFRTTLKQRQIREQMMQTPFPSLMLNAFFIITGGMYASLIFQHYKISLFGSFWLNFFYCSLALAIAYSVKFMGLKLSGWLFNMKEAADSYIFIVFIVNKMIGILLLPFVLILAFTVGDLYLVGLNLSFFLIAALLIYRFILTFGAVRNQVKVNPFHFFLYLCAFELAPLLLVYKGLLLYIR